MLASFHKQFCNFGGTWPLNAVSDRLSKTINKKGFEQRLTQINTLERELADDDTLILKYWIHLPPAELKKSLKKSKKDPDRSWWREEQDWEVFEKFSSAPEVIREMPQAGNAIIFDRTWYGRVTVERIEGFASDAQWQRAYDEINDFENQLANRGMVVLKFWLHISPEEQMARFKAREVTPYKTHKITELDFRNRAKWDDYTVALNELVAKTSKKHAPWRLVPANDKRFARG